MDKQRTLTDLEKIDRDIDRLVSKRYRLLLAYNRAFPTDCINQKHTFLPKGVELRNQLSFNQPAKSRIKP